MFQEALVRSKWRRARASLMAASAALLAAASVHAQVLSSVEPPAQRVHDFIVLRGSGFGAYSALASGVSFSDGVTTIEASHPYVWRDDYIKVRVPVGDYIGGQATPIPKGPLTITVSTVSGPSNGAPFQVITDTAPLSYLQRTQLGGNQDVSQFFGSPSYNLARTKDADVGDVDADGYMDLIDNNSHNVTNTTNPVLRMNLNGRRFVSLLMEPRNAGDSGTFQTVITSGDYIEDGVTYDADLIDLNNDEYADVVQPATRVGPRRVRILMNNHLGVPTDFVEDTPAWFPNPNHPGDADDVDATDVNFDGYVDIGVGYRFSSAGKVYLNSGGTTFSNEITLNRSGSIHDMFFMDANDDGFPDGVTVNESGASHLFLHNGNLANPNYVFNQSLSGSNGFAGGTADFNADGVADCIFTFSSTVTAYINSPTSPGTFTQKNLSGSSSTVYDVEVGDINLDGTVDVIATSITSLASGTVRVWTNDGNANFTEITNGNTPSLLPGAGAYQRLSADLIDLENDGDLDLYITGADGSGVFGFGDVPNQFWENMIRDNLMLEVNQTDFDPGEQQQFITSGGSAGNITALMVLAVDGSPFTYLVDVGTFNNLCERNFNIIVPPGLTGLVIDFIAFGFLKTGKLGASEIIPVTYN